jgi:formate hydrogenlyase transcriptional activator
MTATMPKKILAFHFGQQPEKEVIGVSHGLREVWDAVRMVAPVDSTVLIHGETGTGKELIARAIHDQGRRSHAPYVKVNCAAIPAGLLESELFGHERGAFTGALAQTTGRFELANQGTLFLDEIGDLPLELQPKLLRVLQEQEFERLGSSRTIQVNVRIVAATNLDLAQLVQERRFRADLFYRLNVYPIHLPPLRERVEDIPELVRHFVGRFAAEMEKIIEIIPEDVMNVLSQYAWPGNIRELQNFIERAVILSAGPVLRPPLGQLRGLSINAPRSDARTLADAERDHIVEALRQVGGVMGGRAGAAARLGVKRSTLYSRMQKLGISATRSTTGMPSGAGSIDSGAFTSGYTQADVVQRGPE